MEIVKCVSNKTEFISVVWFVGSFCNYKCSYCRDDLHDGKMPFRDDYTPFINFINKLNEIYPNKKIFVSLLGGEVTYWNKIGEFLQVCKGYDLPVRVVTNGSRSLKWWEKNIDNMYSFIFSYHNESANEAHVTEVMKMANPRCQVNMMIPPDKFDELVQIAERISENAKTFVLPKYLRLELKDVFYPYTDEQLEFFKSTSFGFKYNIQNEYYYKGFTLYTKDGIAIPYSNARKLTIDRLNKWKGWKCWGGVTSFFIDYNLDLYVGQCRRGKIANLSYDYDLPTEPFICDVDMCNCTQDVMESNKEKY